MKELIEQIAKALVDSPDEVSVTAIEGEQTTVLELRVAPGDLGKVIGKQGRTARSIRTITTASSSPTRRKKPCARSPTRSSRTSASSGGPRASPSGSSANPARRQSRSKSARGLCARHEPQRRRDKRNHGSIRMDMDGAWIVCSPSVTRLLRATNRMNHRGTETQRGRAREGEPRPHTDQEVRVP